MGLSILSFGIAFLTLVVFVLVARKGRGPAARLSLVVDLCLAAAAVFQGLAVAASSPDDMMIHLVFARGGAAALAAAELFLLAFAFAFPTWLKPWLRVLVPLLAAAAGLLAYLIFSDPEYIAGLQLNAAGLAIAGGERYELLNGVVALFGVGAAAVHLGRALGTRDRIHRERSMLAFAGVLTGVVAMLLIEELGLTVPGARWPYVLLPLVGFALAAVAAYSLSLARLFDWREIGLTLADYLVLTAAIGVPAGACIGLLILLGEVSPLIPLAGSLPVFLVADKLAVSLSSRRLERLSARRSFGEELESELVHIDLSKGRDYVLGELYALLSKAFKFKDFVVLIEDDRGALRTIYSSTEEHRTGLERGDALLERLERSDVTVLMRSEALADSSYSEFQEPLLALFDALGAEALVLAREGKHIIGAFALGTRKSGGEYTDYDYETLRSIYGKLFVIAFYLRNIARESIVYTVNRELALSDQVIRFALENVATVDSPKADTAWTTKSTRSLGGDFVDFVRIADERWFFVLGDISGKGLSASMNMLILKSMIRSFLKVEKDFSGLVSRINDFIRENLPRGCFFAGVFGYFDLGKGSLYFINCGAPAILFYSPSFDAFIEVGGQGKVLGFARDIRPYLRPRKLALPPGSALVVATDGVIDGANIRGERFGKERLIRSARERLDKSAREIADGTIGDLLSFTEQKQEDDITLLIMKIAPRSAK
jgi:hypothetical protein